MAFIDKNNPRFDASSIVVTVDGTPIECETIGYGDAVTVGEARALGHQASVGDTAGIYKADEASMTMHKDHHVLLIGLLSRLGSFGASRLRHTITVSYAEIDPRTGAGLPQVTDILLSCRYLKTQNSHNGGAPDPLKITCSWYVYRIIYNNGFSLI